MASVADRLALAQLAAFWTASIVLEVRWGVGEVWVTRRRRSIWVGPDAAVLQFPANDVSGQEKLPVRDPEKKNIPRQTTGPASRWFLQSTAPIRVTQIDLVSQTDQLDIKTHVLVREHVGAVMGSIVVPLDYSVSFVLRRDHEWANSIPSMNEGR